MAVHGDRFDELLREFLQRAVKFSGDFRQYAFQNNSSFSG
jgi:hypothetical protein